MWAPSDPPSPAPPAPVFTERDGTPERACVRPRLPSPAAAACVIPPRDLQPAACRSVAAATWRRGPADGTRGVARRRALPPKASGGRDAEGGNGGLGRRAFRRLSPGASSSRHRERRRYLFAPRGDGGVCWDFVWVLKINARSWFTLRAGSSCVSLTGFQNKSIFLKLRQRAAAVRR